MTTKRTSLTKLLCTQIVISLSITFATSAQELWMVLTEGGKGGVGTIAHYDPSSSTFTTDFSFPAPYPGANPFSGVVEVNNKFYGVTEGSGELFGGGGGVLYEWDPATKVYTRLHDFEVATGISPHGPLQALGTKLYGTTSGGGLYHRGGIFEWDLSTGTYSQKIHFSPLAGINCGPLTYYNGKFYGVTTEGGVYNRGVFFQWDPVTNAYVKMIDRTNEMSGRVEGAGLALYNGKLYGATWGGGTHDAGVIFEWDPATNEYIEKIDNEMINGGLFASTLTLHNGKFYGNTYSGGLHGAGVIFEWDPVTNVFTKKVDLNYQEGHHPFFSPLTFINNKAYGAMMGGGVYNLGVLYEWDPLTNIFTMKVSCHPANGIQPIGALTYKDGLLYGVATYEGAGDAGVLFAWNFTTNKVTKLADFNGSILGRIPRGTLLYMNDKFYGSTIVGGAHNLGTLFEWDPSQNVFKKKIDFTNRIGISPSGTLASHNGKLYGVTNGGVYDFGTIFEWDPASNTIAKKADLTSIRGWVPTGLTFSGGKFYGVTTYGGAYGQGLLFEWDPITNALAAKVNFNDTSGAEPLSLMTNVNEHLYGITTSGGDNSSGVIFEYIPATNTYTKRLSFPAGHSPQGLTFANDKFYGVTEFGGLNNAGIIFEWTINAPSYTKKVDFNAATGAIPRSPLTYSSSGKFYGTTFAGGANNFGVLFEWDPATNQYQKLTDFSATTGGHPFSSKILEVFNVALPPIFVQTPADGATGQKIKLDVIAKPLKGATTYTIQLSTASDFSSGVLSKSGANKQRFDSLRYNTVYYTRAKTNLDPRFGKVTSFQTVGPEFYSYVVSPPNNATSIRTATFISSNPVTFATNYTIQLSEVPDFSTIRFSRSGNTRTLYFTGLKNDTKYYTRVRTNLTSLWGQVRSFTTQGAAIARLRTEDVPASAETEMAAFDLKVFPNPFEGQFQVYVETETDQQAKMQLTDLAGKQIVQMERSTNSWITIDHTGSAGMYLLRVNIGNATKTIRVAKTR